MRQWHFEGKTALITGASSGIGEEFACQLHRLGVDLVLVARRKERLEKIAETLNAKRAQSCIVLVADLCARHGEESLQSVERYLKQHTVDILINNAGRGSFGTFESLSLEEEEAMIALNIVATQVLAHAALGQMKQRREGVLLSVSSVAAFQPLPFMATYAGTKAFNFFHTMALRAEARGSGVRVVTLCPGPTATEFGGVARVPGTATGGIRDSVSMVVNESLEAIRKNRAFIVPGFRSWGASLFCRLLPVVWTTRVVRALLIPALRVQETEAGASLESP